MALQTVLVIGGAGAQGVPIVKALSADGKYAIRILTRNAESPTAKELLRLPNVGIAVGDSQNESDLRAAFKGVDMAFVNLNSFALGIRAEMYWGTRIFEIAVESGVKHYIWSALEPTLKLSGYNEDFRVAHYEGKSRVTDWMHAQPQIPMKWSVITTGPYIEMLSELLRPTKAEDGTAVFELPLEDGAVPFIHLDDIGLYIRWILNNPSESAGLNLKVSTAHVTGNELASAFTSFTGKPAHYHSMPLEEWISKHSVGPPSYKLGSEYEGPDDPTLLTIEKSFSNWWRLYQKSAENKGLIKTDYELLDRILPGRVKSVGDWMKKVRYTGEKLSVLKNYRGH
ncbi:NAD(P)-binding protein [Glonium stellatum]|uniref:NAD(P)-binding protein n=1 Tax=Glonium stellatum TaxID=574774 RepID=A0A8E2ET88_9PEZI|nr:NAD(P)-binding protein [Glonium stellatum]